MTHRKRTRGAFHNEAPSLLVFRHDGSSYSVSGGPDLRVGTVEEMTDVVSRGFQPGKTWLNNPMNRISTTYTSQFAQGRQNVYRYSYTSTDTVVAIGSRSLSREAAWNNMLRSSAHNDISSLISLACTKALSRVAAPEVAGLVALAELRETIHTLRHPLDGILKVLGRNAPRTKRDVRKWYRRAAEGLADQHLTIIFGILPFLSDIQGILKAISSFDGKSSEMMTARGSASSTDSKSQLFSLITDDDGNNTVTATGHDGYYSTVDVRAYQFYSVSLDLSDALGLSPREIPRALWQTLPMSFIVDWFVNMSEFLSALTPKPSVTLGLSGYTVVQKTLCDSSYSFTLEKRQLAGWTGRYEGGTTTRNVIAKRRVPGSIGQYIGLHVKQNRHQDLLDLFKITASISLIIQRLKQYR